MGRLPNKLIIGAVGLAGLLGCTSCDNVEEEALKEFRKDLYSKAV